MKKITLSSLFSLALFISTSASAGVVSWADWQKADVGANGTVVGTVAGIDVKYTGDVSFAQTGTGTNYWTEGSPAPYTGNSVIDNAPTASEMIAMRRANITNTVSFSKTVIDPIITIVSQGRTNLPVTYDFDASFEVLSEGRGYWGDGWYNHDTATDSLQGFELHAAIQFKGSFDSISWVADRAENWHGFTVGLGDQTKPPVTTIPEPATALLFGLGLLGFVGFKRKFK